MTEQMFADVDRYFESLYTPVDQALASALAANAAAHLPAIDVSPAQGKLLQILARSIGARRILEIGTLGGYSSLWLAGALSGDGRLITLEVNPRHAAVARDNFARAGFAERIELREGPALETLAQLQAAAVERFDFIFIDADKPNNPQYLSWALRLSHRGSVIVFDNVVRNGEILDSRSKDAAVQGTRKLHQLLASERRVSATSIQTVGIKGYDGFAIAMVNADP
jgi:predicted O-methyltransferase YrrM